MKYRTMHGNGEAQTVSLSAIPRARLRKRRRLILIHSELTISIEQVYSKRSVLNRMTVASCESHSIHS